MHNTDRTQQYMETGAYNAEAYPTPAYAGEFETQEAQPYGEMMQEWTGETAGQMEFLGELINPNTGEINAEAELAMAAELLSVSNEQELNQFLGGLVRNIGRGFKRFAHSGLGRTLGGVLRSAAKTALPMVGGALGSLIPVPGLGTALGASLGQAASNALEFEGLSNEDRQFEVARRIVRLGVEGGRALDNLPESEFMTEQEIGSILGRIAGRVLPALGSAVLGGLGGQAASGGQASGGLSGGVNVTSPSGWNVQLGGQAGGQASAGSALGVNMQAPQVPFQGGAQQRPIGTPSVPRPMVPHPPARPGTRPAAGRWIRRGPHLIVLNAF